MLRLLVSLVAAISVPTLCALAWQGTLEMLPAILTAVILHVAFVGLPALVLHLYLLAIRWWSLAFVGVVCGSLPIAVWGWPAMLPGPVTTEAWQAYFYGVGSMALYGAVGGLAFWVCWRQDWPAGFVKRVQAGDR